MSRMLPKPAFCRTDPLLQRTRSPHLVAMLDHASANAAAGMVEHGGKTAM